METIEEVPYYRMMALWCVVGRLYWIGSRKLVIPNDADVGCQVLAKHFTALVRFRDDLAQGTENGLDMEHES